MNCGKFWASEPTQEIEPKLCSTGYGSIRAKTIIDVFNNTVERFGDKNAMATQQGDGTEWKFWTWRKYMKECESFAKSLICVGVQKFDVLNILGFNAPPWLIASIGATLVGCIPAGIYSTNTADACHYITTHSRAAIVVLADNTQLGKYKNINRSDFPRLKAFVFYGEDLDTALASQCKFPVYTWQDFIELGDVVNVSEVKARGYNTRPGHCASLVYTSGTTGPPKAVMLSHDNITWTAQNIIDNYMHLNHEDRIVSYLPLSHIAAQLIDIYGIMALGGCTYFAPRDSVKNDSSLLATLRYVRPTFFFGVPRVWEKMAEKIQQQERHQTGIQWMLTYWAKSVASEHCRRLQYNSGLVSDKQKLQPLPYGYNIAKLLVLNPLKEALGLDQTKGCFSAAAPLSIETSHYFASLDIPIYEVYGQSECAGPHAVSAAKCWKIGTCGRPMKGTESKLTTGTGELCYRGRHVCMGYLYMPTESAETIDDEGFLHSGDIGEFDDCSHSIATTTSDSHSSDGFLRIVGRIKDLIITGGGENVAPALIESAVQSALTLGSGGTDKSNSAISHCLVFGDRRKYLTMLLSLKVQNNRSKPQQSGDKTPLLAEDALQVSQQIGSRATTYAEAMQDPLWTQYIDRGIQKANQSAISSAQRIQKWAWLPNDLSESNGELTSTMKVKRRVVAEKYASLIDSLYQ